MEYTGFFRAGCECAADEERFAKSWTTGCARPLGGEAGGVPGGVRRTR